MKAAQGAAFSRLAFTELSERCRGRACMCVLAPACARMRLWRGGRGSSGVGSGWAWVGFVLGSGRTGSC